MMPNLFGFMSPRKVQKEEEEEEEQKTPQPPQ